MPGLVHVVDDDPSFLTAMERRLKHAGYDVATYLSGSHFLVNLPPESVPICIILDVRIPDLDGPALQKRLAELGSKCRSSSSQALPTSRSRCGLSRRVPTTS